jgi:hypothetical protein
MGYLDFGPTSPLPGASTSPPSFRHGTRSDAQQSHLDARFMAPECLKLARF